MKLKRIFSIGLLFGLFLSLAGCKIAYLQPRGDVAKDERDLLVIAVLLMLLVVIPVIILTVVFARHFRDSNKKAKYRPNWAHSTALEVVWWSIPCFIILILSVLTWEGSHRLDPYRRLNMPGKMLNVQVVALSWKWLFIYPKQHIATVNYLEIPTNRQVQLLITADAPMNSLELPQLAGQIYAMPGMRTRLHFNATIPGLYDGLSTNYSGDGFAGMSFKVNAVSDSKFKNWVKHVKTHGTPLTMKGYEQLAKPSKNNKVVLYSSIPSKLFSHVMMKYMEPAKHSKVTTMNAKAMNKSKI